MGDGFKEVKGWLVDFYTYAVPGFAFLLNLASLCNGGSGRFFNDFFLMFGIDHPSKSYLMVTIIFSSAVLGVITMPLFSLVSSKVKSVTDWFWSGALFNYDQDLFKYAEKYFSRKLGKKKLVEEQVLKLVLRSLGSSNPDISKDIEIEMAKDSMFINLAYTMLFFGFVGLVLFSSRDEKIIGACVQLGLGILLAFLNRYRMIRHTTNMALECFAAEKKS